MSRQIQRVNEVLRGALIFKTEFLSHATLKNGGRAWCGQPPLGEWTICTVSIFYCVVGTKECHRTGTLPESYNCVCCPSS